MCYYPSVQRKILSRTRRREIGTKLGTRVTIEIGIAGQRNGDGGAVYCDDRAQSHG